MMTRKELMDYNKRKDKVIAIRVSEMEYDTIKTAAKTAKVSMTDYIKFTAQLKAMVAVDELKELITQTKKIGNNLNQLTMLANMGKINSVNLTECNDSLNELLKEVKKISGLKIKM